MEVQNPNSYKNLIVGEYYNHPNFLYPMILTKIDLFDNNHVVVEFDNNERLRKYGLDCTKWIPKENEYCLFYDDKNFHPILALFVRQKNNIYYANVFDGKGNIEIIGFNYCKPTPFKVKGL